MRNKKFIKVSKRGSALGLTAIMLLSLTACESNSQNKTDSICYESTVCGDIQDSYIEEDFNAEEYNEITENQFMSVKNNPLSTFAADVDTASYSNVRRLINNNQTIDEGAVRIEEMINYFDYDYDGPKGEDPFGVNVELSNCPWNKDTMLMQIGLKTEDIDFSQAGDSNLVFLLDVSGSMGSNDKLPLVQKSFTLLTENLSEKDRISIVTYAGNDEVILEGATGADKELIRNKLNDLNAGGGTAGSDGIKTAYELAEKYFIEGGNNRVILATDGDLNIGETSESQLSKLVKKKKKNGVYLSVLGFGTGNIKDNKMETLADDGNGNYAYIDSAFEAKRVLVDEMGATLVTVAKDVKFQVEFNPAAIKGYRLIGYENRLMDAQDFNDDTKDGGEIGAGHTVTALYEVVPIDSAYEINETDLKYENVTSEDWDFNEGENSELLTVSIRYKEPDADSSKLLEYPVSMDSFNGDLSSNMKLASAIAIFGMKMRNSEYVGIGDEAMALSLLNDINGNDKVDELKGLINKYEDNYGDTYNDDDFNTTWDIEDTE